MSPEKQRIAIATACGWKWEKLWTGELHGKPIGEQGPLRELPDYLGDLNACHEMEKVLSGYQRNVTYPDRLREIAGYHTFDSLHATAAEKCEAFLRTLELWEEEQ